MMNEESSPFSNPNEINPFADPSAVPNQPSSNTLNNYQPFDGQNAPPPPQSSPPVISATIEPKADPTPEFQPKPFSSGGSYTNQDAIRRQEDLERTAASIEQKEKELIRKQQMSGNKTKNFPPIPTWFPVKPCCFHDISMEIPIESQKTCKLMFYVWQLYLFALFYNFIAAIAFLIDKGDGAVGTFGVSIVNLILCPCLTYYCWYSRIYNALKNDSSFNYMIFLGVSLVFVIFMVIYALGVFSLGTCGWVNATAHLNDGHKAVAVLMYISAILWTVLALLIFFMMKRINQAYRRSGASWEKAQAEFAQNVSSNKSFQDAVVNAASQKPVSSTQY